MLSDRIIATLKFFDLQDFPLTAFELHRYLIADVANVAERLDDQYELLPMQIGSSPAVQLDTVQHHLDNLVETGAIAEQAGMYALPSRDNLIATRLKNYLFGIPRERLISRYIPFTKHFPYVRGIALAGSQAMGLQRSTSDIDLLIITDPDHMWIARTLLTIYFQLFGIRRYGQNITNRFCLNHYLANIREVDAEKNLYKAMEYAKLRPLIYSQALLAFQKANEQWIRIFFPNVKFKDNLREQHSWFQKTLEKLLDNKFGAWLEATLGSWQLKRIKQGKFIFVRDDELSFHPESKHEALLQGFFGK